jgi:hypothetical protein
VNPAASGLILAIRLSARVYHNHALVFANRGMISDEQSPRVLDKSKRQFRTNRQNPPV